jgi:hypothetical protein
MGSQERRMPQDEEQPERDRSGRGDTYEETDTVRGRDDDGRDVEPETRQAAGQKGTNMPTRESSKPAKRKK